jgi:polyhydroxyalkanoate synthase
LSCHASRRDADSSAADRFVSTDADVPAGAPPQAPFLQAGQALLQGFLAAAGDGRAAEMARLALSSNRVAALQMDYVRALGDLWAATVRRQQGGPYAPVASPEPGDRRFAAAEWRDNPYYDYLKQQYLLGARFVSAAVEAAEVDERARQRLRFFARQYVDMLCPANFAATNPDAIRSALDTRGEALARGVKNLIGDVERGRISQTDETAFEVGRNLAVTPGVVIFENDVMQLIQYRPATAKVRKRPLVMVPPCINKYYILDLAPESSFVRHAVAQGNTVFMVSWRNPTVEHGHLSWDDYLEHGVLAAMRIAREVTRSGRLNMLGFCVGGTLLGCALGVLAARGEDWVESVTFLTTMLDFHDVGDIGVFVDEASVKAAEATLGGGGIKSGRDLAQVFNALRANDLVWSYVVNNYLKGKSPEAFDILYWNGDSTNLPGPFFAWYLRHAYLENNLKVPGKARMLGAELDLTRIAAPAYVLATREDHIVPWKSAYRTTQLVSGEKRFVLGASGHIAGVVNPAAKNRRSYWTQDATPPDAEQWLATAAEQPGSWWRDWDAWLARFAGGEKAAPKRLGNARHKPIEDAPGRYVRSRID